jgi:hypothetical protein
VDPPDPLNPEGEPELDPSLAPLLAPEPEGLVEDEAFPQAEIAEASAHAAHAARAVRKTASFDISSSMARTLPLLACLRNVLRRVDEARQERKRAPKLYRRVALRFQICYVARILFR